MREQQDRLAKTEQEAIETEAPEKDAESETKFAGGAPPLRGGANEGTAQLAYEEDANERELKQKVGKLVADKFGGDFKAAFAHYGSDGVFGKSELVKLLSDAGVGNGLTRGAWANGIIDKLDRNDNKAIEWAEFESVFRAKA